MGKLKLMSCNRPFVIIRFIVTLIAAGCAACGSATHLATESIRALPTDAQVVLRINGQQLRQAKLSSILDSLLVGRQILPAPGERNHDCINTLVDEIDELVVAVDEKSIMAAMRIKSGPEAYLQCLGRMAPNAVSPSGIFRITPSVGAMAINDLVVVANADHLRSAQARLSTGAPSEPSESSRAISEHPNALLLIYYKSPPEPAGAISRLNVLHLESNRLIDKTTVEFRIKRDAEQWARNQSAPVKIGLSKSEATTHVEGRRVTRTRNIPLPPGQPQKQLEMIVEYIESVCRVGLVK